MKLSHILELTTSPQLDLSLGLQIIYDISIVLIALVSICLYVVGSIQDAVKLAKLEP